MWARDGKAGLTCLVRGEWARILVACGALLGVLIGVLIGQLFGALAGGLFESLAGVLPGRLLG